MKHRVGSIVIVFSIVIILHSTIGCTTIKGRVESMKPEVRGITHRWGDATEETTQLLTTIRVYNPNPFMLPIKVLTCNFEVNGIEAGHGENYDIHIEKGTESPIVICTEIDNSKITALWIEHLNHGEKSEVNIDAGITFDLKVKDFTFHHHLKYPLETDLLSTLEGGVPRQVEKKTAVPLVGEVTILKITVEALSALWGEVTSKHTNLNLSATIHNDNPYPLPLPRIVYDVELNGWMLASGRSTVNYLLPSHSDKAIGTTIVLDNSQLDECFVSHIENGERSTFSIRASLVFELPQEMAVIFGSKELSIPVWEESYQFDTDILKTEAE